MGNRAMFQELLDLGERIRNKREEVRMTQERLAEKAGISPNTVSRIECGQVVMSLWTFRKLMEALEVDANKLLGNEAIASVEKEALQETFNRIRQLRQRDQEVVEQTMKALVDGLEKEQ